MQHRDKRQTKKLTDSKLIFISLHSISIRVEFFRFPEEKSSLFENIFQVSFVHIPYSPPFRIVFHSSFLCLSVICWLRVCSREWIFNLLISLCFFYSSMLCFLLLISLVSYPNNFIYFQGHCGFNMWYLLLSTLL